MKTKNTTKMSHTPGPWHVAGYGILGPEAKLKDSIAVTSVRSRNCLGVTTWEDDERTANARLIAASPDLLLTLKAIKVMADAKAAELDGGADYHAVAADMMTRMAHLSHRIGDAISKAEGK